MNPEPYKTTDLALVAYLRLQGLKASRLEVDDGEVCWVFAHTVQLDAMCSEYLRGACVDPAEYNKALNQTRGQMHDKLRESN